jgi:copper chaperone CopZ|tara:strand:- start:184 stop:348 length:165 start_codon:yes stop_codon:yes gene_type:complete
MTIRMAVGRLDGFGKITGEAKSRTLTVEYEPARVTVKAIQGTLKQLGYDSSQLQ